MWCVLVFLCRFVDCQCKQQLTEPRSSGWFDSFHRTKKKRIFPRIPCARKILNKLLFAACRSRIIRVVRLADCLLPVAVCHSCVSRSFIIFVFFFLLSCVNSYYSLPLAPSTSASGESWVSAIRNSLKSTAINLPNDFSFWRRPEFCTLRNIPAKRQTNIAWPKRKGKKNKGFRTDLLKRRWSHLFSNLVKQGNCLLVRNYPRSSTK